MPSSKSTTSSTASKSGQKPAAGATAPTTPSAPAAKSSATPRAAAKPATSSTSERQALTRRQARAWQRAEERRRRAITNWSILAILVAIVVIAVLVVKQPWTGLFAPSHKASASTCPAPTATAIGPVPAITPPASPPDVTGTTKTTSDGLQEIDITVGCGAVVQSGQTVVVEYSGWVQSTGKLFDSSFSHQPSECNGTVAYTCSFPISQGSVIQGWVEGIAGMKVGGTRRLIIPPALAYGAKGQPPTIPPDATLVFDVTVVGIQGS